jgi:hypothetical protein
VESKLGPLDTSATSALLYLPRVIVSTEETFPTATLSTTNSTLAEPGANPGHRYEKPATNRLSYGAAATRYLAPEMSFSDPRQTS